MVTDRMILTAASEGEKNRFAKTSTWETCGLACGIAFVVLLFTSLFIGPEPVAGASAATTVWETYVRHHDVMLAQAFLRGVTAFLMFAFVTGMMQVVRRVEGRFSFPCVLALGSALAFSLVMFTSQTADATAVVLAGKGAQAETVAALSALGDTMRHMNGLLYALMLGTASAALLRARACPRFVGWLGLVCVPLFLIAGAGFQGTRLEAVNLAALPVMPLLTVLQSVALLISGRKAVSERAATV